MSRPVIKTCALTGVLTDPEVHHVPVTPEQMADHAEQAWNAGATIVHIHFRDQTPGLGRMPSWEPDVAKAISDAIRARCPKCGQGDAEADSPEGIHLIIPGASDP